MIQNGFVRIEQFTRGHIQQLIDMPIKKWRTKDTSANIIENLWKCRQYRNITCKSMIFRLQ